MFGYGQGPRLQRRSAQPVLRRPVQARALRPGQGQEAPGRGRLSRTASTRCSRWRRSTTTRCARARCIASQLAEGRRQRQDRADRVGPVALAASAWPQDADYDLTIIGHAEAWDIAQLRQPEVLLPLRQRRVPGALPGVRGHRRRQGAARALRADAEDAGRGRAGGLALHAPAAGGDQEGRDRASGRTCRCPSSTCPRSAWAEVSRRPRARAAIRRCGRVAALAATLLFVSLLVFVVVRVLPGDPAAHHHGHRGQPARRPRGCASRWGSNRPLAVQYVEWLGRALRGDLGRSIQYDVPVGRLIVTRLPVTLPLTLLAAGLHGRGGAPARALRGHAPPARRRLPGDDRSPRSASRCPRSGRACS